MSLKINHYERLKDVLNHLRIIDASFTIIINESWHEFSAPQDQQATHICGYRIIKVVDKFILINNIF